MSNADPGTAFSNFWAAQGAAWIKTQEQTTKAFFEGMQAMSSGAPPAGATTHGPAADLPASAADLGRASAALSELWSAATALSGSLAQSFPPAGSDNKTIEATILKMCDPRSWMGGAGEMDDVLGRMAEGPRLADMWDIERRYARVLAAWMTVRRRGIEHHSIVLEAWVLAGRRFNEQMAGLKETAGPKPDSKATLALWTDTANKQLLETQRSEPFLQTQTAMIRASTELRLAQQELVEHFGKQYGFPTRTELDDVHRTVTELRRELRAMRREQRQAPSRASPVFPATQVPH